VRVAALPCAGLADRRRLAPAATQGSDEEDALKEEEEEALRLQREAAQALSLGDYGLDEEGEEASEGEEIEEGDEAPTLGARVSCLHVGLAGWLAGCLPA
jgi:U3 small nucleolar RNA-associated protein 3